MKKKWLAIILMVVCTFFTSIAQVFYKLGAARLPEIASNYHIFIGLVLYAAGAAIFVTALKFGEVTVLYPIIASSYIWVSIFSWAIFSEAINAYKWLGIFMIIFGITTIAFGSKSRESIRYVEAV